MCYLVTALVQKLTPAGQKTAAQISTDFWTIYYPGIQPVYDYIGANFNETIQKVLASPDAPKFKTLEGLLGIGNWTAGVNASPRDLCQDYKNVLAVVATMSKDNQKVANDLLSAAETGQKLVLPTIINIHLFADYKQYESLKASENATVLGAISDLWKQIS